MVEAVKIEPAKKITTCNARGDQNGYLIELLKDGEKTIAYLTVAAPGAFKGYHLHRIRASRYVCIRGKMRIILYRNRHREEHLLDSTTPQRLFIPANIPTGLQNIGEEEAWLINIPDPAYDPHLTNEQVEYTEEELEQGIVK